MYSIGAIYENGVFRPLEPVNLPDGTKVKLCELRSVGVVMDEDLDGIYEIMDRRYSSGETDTAARHYEHQP